MKTLPEPAERARAESGSSGERNHPDVPWRREEFIAQLAHELRGPLGAMRNALHVLRQCGGDTVTIDWVEGVLNRQTNQMSRLVEDLIDQCRWGQNGSALRKEATDLAAIVDRAIETIRPNIDDRGHQLKITMLATPITVEADASRLQRILTNLLANAAKYTDPGGRIELTAARQLDEIVLTVRDTGVGIVPEELPHVFEPFWQSARATDRARGGLGIGLAIVRQLAEMHGGSVSAFSNGPGRGSEFVVRLPGPMSNVETNGRQQ